LRPSRGNWVRVLTPTRQGDEHRRAAEQTEANKELAANRVYLADYKVDTARALAEARFSADQRAADQARDDAASAAKVAAASSEQQAAELQRQIDVLQAKPTERGLVLTLGDVPFTTGRAALKPVPPAI
jgi:hypothetical protein